MGRHAPKKDPPKRVREFLGGCTLCGGCLVTNGMPSSRSAPFGVTHDPRRDLPRRSERREVRKDREQERVILRQVSVASTCREGTETHMLKVTCSSSPRRARRLCHCT